MTEPADPEPSVGWGLLLWRGATRRCPRCGAGRLYKGWFRMVDRCGGCGMRFEREPGFFVGAYLINFAIVIVLLFVLCMVFVAMKAVDHEASVLPVIVVGLPMALLAPVVFYPYSRTIWSAFDIGMTPLSDEERTAAAAALASGDVGTIAQS
ncbi:MAG: DUF983 domain-containing protein [Acidimicrobiales bacterium]|nr:DUF983 domain-containing protein [Acidimicrobiales bacterium]